MKHYENFSEDEVVIPFKNGNSSTCLAMCQTVPVEVDVRVVIPFKNGNSSTWSPTCFVFSPCVRS